MGGHHLAAYPGTPIRPRPDHKKRPDSCPRPSRAGSRGAKPFTRKIAWGEALYATLPQSSVSIGLVTPYPTHAHGNMQVDLRRRDVFMTQQFLNFPQISPALQQMGRETVPPRKTFGHVASGLFS